MLDDHRVIMVRLYKNIDEITQVLAGLFRVAISCLHPALSNPDDKLDQFSSLQGTFESFSLISLCGSNENDFSFGSLNLFISFYRWVSVLVDIVKLLPNPFKANLRELITTLLAMPVESSYNIDVFQKDFIHFVLIVFVFDKVWNIEIVRIGHVNLKCFDNVFKSVIPLQLFEYILDLLFHLWIEINWIIRVLI